MLFVVSFCSFVVLLGILDSIKILKHGLEIAFGVIILISSIRYNFGADYMNYYDGFKLIQKISSIDSLFSLFRSPFDKYEGFELGWVLLNWSFKPIGFVGVTVFTSFFTNIVYYKFIKAYVNRKWYWLALFTYMFNAYLFFVPLSMMRQSFAMVLFVYSFRFILEKKVIKALVVLLFASLYHSSALILLPFIFLGFVSKLKGKVVSVAYAVLFAVFLLSKDITISVLTSALSLPEISRYGEYFLKMEAANDFGIGFVSRVVTLFLPLLFYFADETQSFSNRLMAFMAGISFLIAPFTLIMGFLGRLDYYFMIYNIVAVPLIYSWLRPMLLRNALMAIYLAFTIYSFNEFFKIPDWVTFLHYQTIFSI